MTNFIVPVSSTHVRYGCILGVDDLERFDRGDRLRIARCSRFDRQHGTGFPERWSSVVDARSRVTRSRRRHCCVQNSGSPHSDRSSCHQSAWRVSDAHTLASSKKNRFNFGVAGKMGKLNFWQRAIIIVSTIEDCMQRVNSGCRRTIWLVGPVHICHMLVWLQSWWTRIQWQRYVSDSFYSWFLI